jgi:LytS/YehU family sensor histidine kinase
MTYLSKFARLMRFILENSRKSFISLSEEINTLQLYMELEQIRFKNKFDFNIDTPANLSKDTIYLPPMLLQPIVENAIKHGLRNKEGKGMLQLSFNLLNEMLHCVVKDDGIGRKKAAEIAKEKSIHHVSLGMDVTRERLEGLSRNTHQKAGLEITDLSDDQGQASGTLVNVFIPYEAD